MRKSWILKRALIIVAACLTLAWAGAIYAAEGQTSSNVGTSSDGEGLQLIKSDAESVILELRTPSFQIAESSVNGTVYHLVNAPGCGQTDDVGQPQLPVRGTLLGIPASAEYSLRVIEVEQETLPGQYNVYPASRPVLERDGEGNPIQLSNEFARDDTIYSSNVFHPVEVAEVGSSAFIRDQRIVPLRFFPLQYNAVSGELRHYSRIRVEVTFSYPDGQPRLSAARAEDESFREVFQNALLNYDSAQQWRTRPPVAASSGPMLLGQGEPSFKVLVDEDGMYQLTYTDLVSAGMELGGVSSGDFELYNLGQEIAIYVADEDDDGEFDEEDYILFYGQQVTTTYTSTNVYWLSTGTGDGLRMAQRDGTLGASTVLTYFNTTGHWEQDLLYKSWLPAPPTIPSDEEKDHWFWDYARAPDDDTKEFGITLDHLAVGSPPYSATVRGCLNGDDTVATPYDHHAKVYMNGHLVHDGLWSGEGEHEFETDVSSSYLLEGSNVISLTSLLPDPPVPELELDFVYINWFEIDFRRNYSVENDLLFFDGDETGTWRYEVGEFLTSTIAVFDVTDAISLAHIISTTVEEMGSYTVKFRDSISGEHHYLALTPSQYKTPVVVEDSPSDLRGSNGADYIIITHPAFEDAVLPLRDHRDGPEMRTMVVDVQDVYDEFSYGVFNPGAIRDFLKYAYENWVPPAPSYVLLVGDANYDFKDHLGKGEPNYVPPYLVYTDEWMGETAADNRFVCVSGDDELPDMNIGRFPAQTVAQASAMVSKTVDYETALPGGSWRQEVFFLADDPDDPEDPNSPNHFWSLSDDIADSHLPPAPLYTAEKVYYGISPYTDLADVQDAIAYAFDTGRLFINYVGHAGPVYWGGYPPGFFFMRADVATLPSGEGKMPIVMAMACAEGYFIFPNSPGSDSLSCIGETMVRTPGKGSVANWSPTSFGTSSGQHYLHTGFYDAVFRDNVHGLGPATDLGKVNLYQHAGGDHRELIDTYMVFGDPALHMPIAQTYMAFLPLGFKGY